MAYNKSGWVVSCRVSDQNKKRKCVLCVQRKVGAGRAVVQCCVLPAWCIKWVCLFRERVAQGNLKGKISLSGSPVRQPKRTSSKCVSVCEVLGLLCRTPLSQAVRPHWFHVAPTTNKNTIVHEEQLQLLSIAKTDSRQYVLR